MRWFREVAEAATPRILLGGFLVLFAWASAPMTKLQCFGMGVGVGLWLYFEVRRSNEKSDDAAQRRHSEFLRTGVAQGYPDDFWARVNPNLLMLGVIAAMFLAAFAIGYIESLDKLPGR